MNDRNNTRHDARAESGMYMKGYIPPASARSVGGSGKEYKEGGEFHLSDR
jgi:hypothetical protein